VINGLGIYTDLGGAILSPAVWAAMTEANAHAVDLPELLSSSGRCIAELVGAEAARVTPGASAAIALATAACIARGDGPAMERLPDTTGLAADVLVQRVQRSGDKYGRMAALAGARLVEVDGAEGLERALGSGVAAAVFVPAHLDGVEGAVPLVEVARLASAQGIPTLVDAAYLNYPPETMSRFTKAGADLVCFSAKYFYGPNGGGFVAGRADLVADVAAVDFTGYESGRWRTFGRPFKLDRHTVVGTAVALEEWFELDHEGRWRSYERAVGKLERALAGLPGVTSAPRFLTMQETLEPHPVNCLLVTVAGGGTAEARRALRDGEPSIRVHLEGESLIVAVDAMRPDEVDTVARRLRAVLTQR